MSWGTFSDTLNRLAPFSLILFGGLKLEIFPLGRRRDRVKNDQIFKSAVFHSFKSLKT